ncbi:MAG: ectonucleotide pyrophosphatase/phosphodiesterase, partial [Ignavibacteriaceae bacterium]|nr:ectonucleotide pyrophosphatase/phosphodiesterase [Ignavibacteriaceae bacterium]
MKKLLFVSIIILFSVFLNAQQPYVLLVSFDGFRWDYLNRNLTPTLDSVENQGVRALSLQPSFPSKTFPNHYSIVTGMYPEHHGIISNDFENTVTGEKYKLNIKEAVTDAKWYDGEAFWQTAEKNKIKTASYFWPGSEVTLSYRHPSYFMEYDKKRKYSERVNGVIEWLKLPYSERPHFITLYFESTDTDGHRYGPNSAEVNKAIAGLDSIVAEISGKLHSINMKDSVNIIFVSDHGMAETPPDKKIEIDKTIKDYKFKTNGTGPLMMIQPDKKNMDSVYSILKRNENHYKVYKKTEMPLYYHYNEHAFIYDIVAIADLGWSLVPTDNGERKNNYWSAGNHGYDNHQANMHGIFVASGPAFKKNYITGTVRNID